MIFVVYAFCVLTAVLGAVGMVSPASLEGISSFAPTPIGLYTAAGIRILLGVALMVVASRSRVPKTLWAFGMFLVVAGLMLPFLGVEFIRGIIDWWLALGPGFLRAWGVTSILFSALLAYAVTPGKDQD